VVKVLLGSILLVPFLIARYGASFRNPHAGLRRTVAFSAAFFVVYLLAIIHLYFRIL
jgi:hypothetical protein